MNLNALYVIIIKYFFVMFIEHTSLSVEGILKYYEPKSFFGLLETVSPHLFGMGLVLFILTHFYAVIKDLVSSRVYSLSIGLFIVMLLSNILGFFIGESFVIVATIKLFMTLFFVFLSFTMMVYLSFKLKE